MTRHTPTNGRLPVVMMAAATLAGIGLIWLLLALPVLDGTINWSLDYLAYRDAAIRLGAAGSLYSAETTGGPFHPGPTGLYVYPPPLALTVLPLSQLSLADGAIVWYWLHLAALAVACALMPVSAIIRLASFGIAAFSFAVLRDLTMGNVSVLLMVPMAAGWRWLDRPLGSIAMAVTASVRVSHGLFIIWLALRRAWRPLLWMALAGLVIVFLSLPFVRLEGYADYLSTIKNVGDTTGVLRNSDLASAALAFGMPEGFAGWALIPGFVIGIVAVILSVRRDPAVGYMVTLAASYLLVPLLWDHYLSFLVLPAAFLAARGRPWALALPLLSWAPAQALPFVVITATLLPFLARDPELDRETTTA